MFSKFTPHPRLLTSLAIVLVLGATFMAYWPGLHGPFLFDDNTNIVANTALHFNSLAPQELLRAAFSSRAGLLYRPLSMLSFAFNNYFFGSGVFSFKLTNVAIHLVNSLLILWLSHCLLLNCRRHYQFNWTDKQLTWASVIITAAWALHPLNLTSVMYVVQRMTSLAALFTIAGMLSYVHGRARTLAGRSGWPLVWLLTPFFGVLGVLSKEDAALLPLYLLVIEWLIFSFRSARGNVARNLVVYFCGGVVLPALAFIVLLIVDPAWLLFGYAIRNFSLSERLLTEPRVVWLYIQWTFVPNIRHLALYHDDLKLSTGLLSPLSTLWSLLALMALLTLAIWQRKRRPLLSLGILFFFSGQIIESTVIPLELTFEHRNYLPDYGLLLAVFSLILFPISRYSQQPRFLLRWSVAILTLPILFSVTQLRASEWDSYRDFTSYEALHHPDSPRAVYSLGQMYAILALSGVTKTPDEALRVLTKAASLTSNIMPYTAMMITSAKLHYPVNPEWQRQAVEHLRSHPLTSEDNSALNSLTNCLPTDCKELASIDYTLLQAAFQSPNLHRLVRSEADLWTIFANYLTFTDAPMSQIIAAMQNAVNCAPNIPNYRISLSKGLMIIGAFPAAELQIRELSRLNKFGSLDVDIASLKSSLTATRALRNKSIKHSQQAS